MLTACPSCGYSHKSIGSGVACPCCYKAKMIYGSRPDWAAADAADLAVYYRQPTRGPIVVTAAGRAWGYV